MLPTKLVLAVTWWENVPVTIAIKPTLTLLVWDLSSWLTHTVPNQLAKPVNSSSLGGASTAAPSVYMLMCAPIHIARKGTGKKGMSSRKSNAWKEVQNTVY